MISEERSPSSKRRSKSKKKSKKKKKDSKKRSDDKGYSPRDSDTEQGGQRRSSRKLNIAGNRIFCGHLQIWGTINLLPIFFSKGR